MHDRILNALQKNRNGLCVAATIGEGGQPQSAVLAFAVLNDLSIILATSYKTRKWENLKKNPKIALSFGWSFSEPNLQYEGTAKLLENGDEFKELDKIYFEKHPEIMEFRDGKTVIIKVTPHWIRLSDYSVQPPKIDELSL